MNDPEAKSFALEKGSNGGHKMWNIFLTVWTISVSSIALRLTFLHNGLTFLHNADIDTMTEESAFLLTCPRFIDKSLNDKGDNIDWYDEMKLSRETIEDDDESEGDGDGVTAASVYPSSIYPVNMTEDQIFKLKNNTYDGSDWNYYQFKEVMADWKMRYGKLLKSGDKIFESACGIGINLLMTVDVLETNSSIKDLEVYGAEYRASSTADANNILGQLLPKTGNATLGTDICRGDATDMFFVPSNSFDLAFTGYIDPIQDPLNLEKDLGRKVKWEDLCEENGEPTENGKRDQAAVEEWYAKWVAELIRIAKPGKPIAIEQVSLPTCKDDLDWGGVNRGWWNYAVMKYGWDINIFSIQIKEVYPKDIYPRNVYLKGRTERYNVYMEKKN